MDLRGCVFVVIVLIHSLCFALVSASDADGYNELAYLSNAMPTGNMLVKKLVDDINRQMSEIDEHRDTLMGQVERLQERKRQLEIRKRTPIRCLVNVVSCWKRKRKKTSNADAAVET